MKQRYEFVDIMKGICILLVVGGHIGVPIVRETIFSYFRMPLYYVLSGLFFSQYNGIKTFIYKKINNLIIPYIFFSLFTLAIVCVFMLKEQSLNFSSIFYKTQKLHNAPIWFLLSLFTTSILYYITSYIKNIYYRFAACTLISLIGYFLGYYNVRLPFFIDTSLSALIFYQFGSFLNKSNILNDKRHIFKKTIFFSCLFIIASFLFYQPKNLDLRLNIIPFPYLLYILVGMFGTLSIMYISKILDTHNDITIIHYTNIPIKYFGRYSIIILGTHWMFIKLSEFYFIPHLKNNINGIDLLLLLIVTLIISIPTIYFFTKHLPLFCAQKPLIKVSKQ